MADIDVRARIVREATRLFAEQGYGSTSVRQLVEAAGVTKPTLYYYFDSKEALFLKIVHEQLDHLQWLVEDALAHPGTIRTRLALFIDRYIQGALKNRSAVRLLMTAQHRTDGEQPDIDIMSMHLRKLELLESLFRDGVDRGELRTNVDLHAAVLTFVGTVNLYLVAALHGMPLADGYAETLLDIFFYGVAQP